MIETNIVNNLRANIVDNLTTQRSDNSLQCSHDQCFNLSEFRKCIRSFITTSFVVLIALIISLSSLLMAQDNSSPEHPLFNEIDGILKIKVHMSLEKASSFLISTLNQHANFNEIKGNEQFNCLPFDSKVISLLALTPYLGNNDQSDKIIDILFNKHPISTYNACILLVVLFERHVLRSPDSCRPDVRILPDSSLVPLNERAMIDKCFSQIRGAFRIPIENHESLDKTYLSNASPSTLILLAMGASAAKHLGCAIAPQFWIDLLNYSIMLQDPQQAPGVA